MKPQAGAWSFIRRLARPAAFAAGISVAGYMVLVTWVSLSGPWLGCVWFATDRPTVEVVFPNSPAANAGLLPGDLLTSADGLPLSSQWTSAYFEANMPIGRPVQLEVRRSGVLRRVSITPVRAGAVRPDSAFAWLYLVVGWLTCGLAFWIAFHRRGHLPAVLAAVALIAYAVIYTACAARGFGEAWRGLPPGLRHVLILPALLGLFFAPPLLLFVLEFPRRWPSRRALWTCLPTALLSPLTIYYGFYGRLAPRPDVAIAAPGWLAPAWMIAVWAVLIGTVAVGIGQYRREDDLNHRRRLRVIVCGVLISVAGSFAGTWLSVHGWRWLNASALVAAGACCAFLVAAMPLSFGYAVLRHRLFDLSIIIRLGIRYALSKGLILSIAPACAVLFVIDIWRQSERPLAHVIREESNVYLFLAVLAVVAHTQRRRWLSALDRRFYRSRYDGRRVLSKLIANLRNPVNRETAAAVALEAISSALQPKWAAIAGHERGSEARCLAVFPEHRAVPAWTAESLPAALSQRLGRPVQVGPDASWLNDLSPEHSARMSETGAEMLIPVAAGPDCDLLIILGARRSEEPYSDEDKELLMAVAHSIELAIERSPDPSIDPGEENQYCFGSFTLDPAARFLRRNGETIALGAKPFDLLVFLVERRGEVVSKEKLLRGVWPESVVEEANLAQNISFLRKVLGEKAGENRYISTIPGRGYSFVALLRQHRTLSKKVSQTPFTFPHSVT